MFISVGFIIGASLGSFVKVVADRVLAKKTLTGRSVCPHCQHQLTFWDLIPLLSYIILGGRCRYCHQKINWEYPLVEIVMGVLVAYLFWNHRFLANGSFLRDTLEPSVWGLMLTFLPLLFNIFLMGVLVALTITDLKKMLIPDKIVLPAILVTLIYLLGVAGIQLVTGNFSQALQALLPHLLSGLLIYLFFMVIILVTQGKGMGGGDSKLGALIGLSLGFPLSLLSIMLSFFLGATVALVMVAGGKRHFGQTLPFGPFMVAATLITIFGGDLILEWYLNLSF